MKLKKILSIVFILAVLGAWIFYILKHYQDISDSFKNTNLYLFFMASSFLIVIYFIAIFNWRSVLKMMGFSIPYSKACRIWFLSNLAKYIPGTIWIPLGRSIYTSEENISVPKTFLSWVIEIYLTLLSVITLITILQFFYPFPISIWKGIPFLILLLFLFPLFFTRPAISILGYFSHKKLFRKFRSKFKYLKELFGRLKIRDLLLPFTLNILIQFLFGLWLFFLTVSVVAGTPTVFNFIFIWIVSWFISYVVVFLPGGIGLREGILVLFFTSGGIALGSAIVISLLTRIQFVIVDGLLGLIFLKEH